MGYTRNPGSLYRVFVRLGFRNLPKKSKHNKHYDTPTALGFKWQLDVKAVPAACYSGKDGKNSTNA